MYLPKPSRAHTLVSALIGYASFLIAYILRFYVFHGYLSYGFFTYNIVALFFGAVHYAVYAIAFYGRTDMYRRFGKQVQRTIYCESACLAITFSLLFITDLRHISRLVLLMSMLLSTLLNCIKHNLVMRSNAAIHKSGVNQRKVILIGEGLTADRYAYIVMTTPDAGHQLIGSIASWPQPYDCAYLGVYENTADLLAEHKPDLVVVALPSREYVHLENIICACEHQGLSVRIIPCYEEHVGGQLITEKFEDIQMIGLRDIPLSRVHNALIKRAMDLAIAIPTLILFSPLMVATALGVKLSTRDSVFFRQVRVGKDNVPFDMLKFRSMKPNDVEESAWSQKTDDRRTFFGALIRKLSIDELPQLINVVRGEMSIIGPRPEIPHFVEQFRGQIPLYMLRHAVKPGITGLAQVNGLRGDTSIRQRIQCDLDYIENWTIWMDIRILLRTIPAMINDERLPGRKNKSHQSR